VFRRWGDAGERQSTLSLGGNAPQRFPPQLHVFPCPEEVEVFSSYTPEEVSYSYIPKVKYSINAYVCGVTAQIVVRYSAQRLNLVSDPKGPIMKIIGGIC